MVTIDVLSDDILVEIFFYVNIRTRSWVQNPWHSLVHVCHRWRYLVLASPHYLDLRLQYRGQGPVSEVLDAWPVLPVTLISESEFLSGFDHPKLDQRWWDNTVDALESERYNDRICEIYFSDMTNLRLEIFVAAMQRPFPELTRLEVSVDPVARRNVVPIFPSSFLSGSAPRLRTLKSRGIPFPSMPKLLLSANDLVTLTLRDIPDSGYISPGAMATALTVMTRLETLCLRFRSPRSRPDSDLASRPLPPPTRFVVPSLTRLTFKGVYEYLEDLLARIDVPRLQSLSITFFMDLDFEVPQLHRIIGHAEEFKTLNSPVVSILDRSIQLNLSSTGFRFRRRIELSILCKELDWQLSSLAQICGPSFPLISTWKVLDIKERGFLPSSYWKDDIENAQWLELLNPFTALEDLRLSDGVAQRVYGALRELSGERVTEVLPTLRNLFIDALPPLEDIHSPFLTARQLSDHPVAIHFRVISKFDELYAPSRFQSHPL